MDDRSIRLGKLIDQLVDVPAQGLGLELVEPQRLGAASGTYYHIRGTDILAEDWADLTDGQLTNRITLDENGVTRSNFVWTGTTTDG